ncbi:MAG: hypothetical protein GWP16_03415, partial [Nitrospirae bacterium]|nr:hypothetical protein [Nitrospirota bacterium]
GADTEIRVEQNITYTENLEVPATFNSGSLAILGGWDATFSTRDPDPEHTVLDGGATWRVLEIAITGGSFLIDGFTLTNGVGSGAGIFISQAAVTNTAHIVIRNNWVAENHLLQQPAADGGGINAVLNGTMRLEILDCLVYANTATTWNQGSARGGGLFFFLRGNSSILVEGCDIHENSVESDGGSRMAGGMFLETQDDSTGVVRDTFLFGNSILGTGTSEGSGGFFRTHEGSSMEVVQSGWAANEVDGGDATPQLVIEGLRESSLRMADSGLAQGDAGGLDILAASTAIVHLVNMTVADHPGTGILATQEDTSTLAIYNTIAYGNGTDLTTSGTVDTGSNLVGVDPLFVDPTTLDYYLTEGSPAENMGDNYPPGGLSPVDVEGSSRVVDGIVDIGFAEGIDVIFACSFETGDISTWVDDGA